MPLSHPPLLTIWRQDTLGRQAPGGALTRTRAMRFEVQTPIDAQTDADLRISLDGPRYDVLVASTGMRIAPPATATAAAGRTPPTKHAPKRLVETPGAVYKSIWADSAQPIGMNTFEFTRRHGYEPKSVPSPMSQPQTLSAWFKEYGAADPNARLGRRTAFTSSVRLHGQGTEAFRTNVRQMKRGAL
ncbi:hypothetical protein T492DRAFT_1093437 [Pavlovales sp. CCMP2436]|nr:hypothetical protein T492DRAFT_1093437 [Pavlovales sp. CCMP2436]